MARGFDRSVRSDFASLEFCLHFLPGYPVLIAFDQVIKDRLILSACQTY